MGICLADSARLRKGEESGATLPGHERLCRRPRRCRRNRPLAQLSRRRTAHVAENAGSLPARRRPVPLLSRRSSGRRAHAAPARQTHAGRRARLHGGAARRRRRQPLADARPRRRPLIRPLPGTQRQGQSRRACRRARAQAGAAACRNRLPLRPPSASPMRICAPAKRASPGSSRAMPRCWACFMARACAFPKRSASSARTSTARATRSPSPARATRRAWCRCCRRSAG